MNDVIETEGVEVRTSRVKWVPPVAPQIQFLAAPEDVDRAAWDGYFGALKSRLLRSWNGAVESYKALRAVRKDLGLPFVTTPEGASDPKGALTPDQQQQMLELGAVVKTSANALDDVIANKRKVAFDETSRSIAIEALPDDFARVVAQGDRVLTVDAKTGQPIMTGGTIEGTVGVVWVIPVAIGAAVITTVAVVYVAVRALDTIQVLMQEKTTQTLAKGQNDLVKSGAATPEQASVLTTGLLDATAGLRKAEGETAEKKSLFGLSPDTASTLKTLAIVAAIIAALYFAAKLVPEFTRRPRELPA